jgi:hypothetical protein
MMRPAIDNPASYEIRALIRYLHATNMSAAKIHRELFALHAQDIRQWAENGIDICKLFQSDTTKLTMNFSNTS